LENGNILYFPPAPGGAGFEIPNAVLDALQGTTQDARAFFKNIAYKPNKDAVAGLLDKSQTSATRDAMREYSQRALRFMAQILPEYAAKWKVDYASFRSIEERGRKMPRNKRNDLLHVDAFPTRPVFGDLILRCFTNVSPSQPREWLTSDPFALLAVREARNAGLDRYAAKSGSPVEAAKRAVVRRLHRLGAPVVDRSPYDAFMLHFHDWLKGNTTYQATCPKYRFDLPPGSTWMVFTDVVPHAVLGGRLAMEQTVIVSRKSLADPSLAPSAILERLAGRTMTV
jgi:hypothetical protein